MGSLLASHYWAMVIVGANTETVILVLFHVIQTIDCHLYSDVLYCLGNYDWVPPEWPVFVMILWWKIDRKNVMMEHNTMRLDQNDWHFDKKILNEFSWNIVFQFLYNWIIFLHAMRNWL